MRTTIMASGCNSNDSNNVEGKGSQHGCDKLDSILAVVTDIKKSQDGMSYEMSSR